MKNLYKKLHVENLYDIQEELKFFYTKLGPLQEKNIKHRYERHYGVNIDIKIFKLFKLVSTFINDRAKCPIEFLRYYITPPKKQWAHILMGHLTVFIKCV